MLSGNGRHRRPRQAPALLVAAGVTGSAIAIPLLGAGSASAAEGLNWDRVAECESGGSWSQNSGNGFYGGLQLTQEDWEKYGGLDYAVSADQASRGQQISVAEKVLADQGVGAWRTCGLFAGLGQGAPAADAGTAASGSTGASASPNTGDASASPAPSATSNPSSGAVGEKGSPKGTAGESADPGKSANSDAASDAASAAESGKEAGGDAKASPGASPSASASKSDDSDKLGRAEASSTDTATEEAGTGRHRGAVAEEGKSRSGASDSSGRHASRGLNAWGGTVADSSPVSEEGSSAALGDSLAVGGGWGVLH